VMRADESEILTDWPAKHLRCSEFGRRSHKKFSELSEFDRAS